MLSQRNPLSPPQQQRQSPPPPQEEQRQSQSQPMSPLHWQPPLAQASGTGTGGTAGQDKGLMNMLRAFDLSAWSSCAGPLNDASRGLGAEAPDPVGSNAPGL